MSVPAESSEVQAVILHSPGVGAKPLSVCCTQLSVSEEFQSFGFLNSSCFPRSRYLISLSSSKMYLVRVRNYWWEHILSNRVGTPESDSQV